MNNEPTEAEMGTFKINPPFYLVRRLRYWGDGRFYLLRIYVPDRPQTEK